VFSDRPDESPDAVSRRRTKLFLPGWGTTADIWTPFAAPGDRLGGEIEAGADVVAWSLGAMRALEAATETELGSLTLVGATGQFVRRDDYRCGWPKRTLARMSERLADNAGAVWDEFLALALAPGEELAAPLPREQELAVLEHGLAYLGDFTMLERASDIHCPVRLLHGGRDRVCPPTAARLLADALPQAELTVWPEAGHAPFLTQPDRFRSWLLP